MNSDAQDPLMRSSSEKRSVSDQEDDERSQKRVKVDDQSSQLTADSTGDNNSFVDIEEKTTGATIHDHDFEVDYNEESDEDWAEGNESVHSETSSTFEMFHSATFGPAGEDVTSVDYEEPTWTSFTPEECAQLQEEAKQLGVMKFMKKYHDAQIPVVKLIEAFNVALHPSVAAMAMESQLWALLRAAVSRFMRRRKRLDTVNTLEDVAELLQKANNVMIVTGAGVSVSCGIPDFRSETGIYSRLQEFELDDPQQMFDIQYFRESPEIFYSFAKELYPSNYEPSPSHMFVKLMEEKGKLLRNYTQNIDTLEHKAGIRRIVNCHGSFATASCVTCGYKCDGKKIEKYIFEQKVPPCPNCSSLNTNKTQDNADDADDEDNGRPPIRGVSIMKPDITFFGESLPAEFDRLLELDTNVVDLLIVMGSSLKVSPVSEIMTQIPHSVPQILINRTPITHMTFDIQLLGDCDVIVPELCRMLGWDLKHHKLPGGSALSDESWSLSKQGDGDLVEIVDPETKEVKHKERKLWKFHRDGLYTFPGAVVTDRYLEGHSFRVVSSDEDNDSESDNENEEHNNHSKDEEKPQTASITTNSGET